MPRSRSSEPERGFDPPAAAHRELLAGARLEQAGENAAGAVAYLHALLLRARGDPRASLPAEDCAGEPASSDGPRHAPNRAARLVLGDDRAAASDEARRAFNSVAAHAAEHDSDRAVSHRSRRPTRASDRPTACSRSLAPGVEPDESPSCRRLERQVGIAGATRMRQASIMPSSATRVLRRATAPSWRAKYDMKIVGRCWVTRIGPRSARAGPGTRPSAGCRRSRRRSRAADRSVGIARSGGSACDSRRRGISARPA